MGKSEVHIGVYHEALNNTVLSLRKYFQNCIRTMALF